MNNLPSTTTPRRRSSRRVTVPFLAAMCAAPLIGCDDSSQSADNEVNTETSAVIDTYRGVDDCADAGFYSRSQCEDLYRQAADDYFANVQHFATREDCEKESLSCHDRSGFVTGSDEQQQTQQSQSSTATASHGGGGGGVFIFHNSGGSASSARYAPDYRGFAVARPVSGSAMPQARAVYATPSSGYATLSGVTGLVRNESMVASRAAFSGTSAGKAGYGYVSSSSPTSVASRPSFVSSARGGFGSVGHSSFGGGHASVGG